MPHEREIPSRRRGAAAVLAAAPRVPAGDVPAWLTGLLTECPGPDAASASAAWAGIGEHWIARWCAIWLAGMTAARSAQASAGLLENFR